MVCTVDVRVGIRFWIRITIIFRGPGYDCDLFSLPQWHLRRSYYIDEANGAASGNIIKCTSDVTITKSPNRE